MAQGEHGIRRTEQGVLDNCPTISQIALSCLTRDSAHSTLSILKPGVNAGTMKAKENMIKFTGQGKEIQY